MPPRVSTVILLALSAMTFFAWGVHYADFDLWWDELDSLTEYALVDFTTTATKYPYPNNHIFFNLVSNAVTRAWGERDIYQIMDQVPVLRWIQWLLSAGTIGYVFFAGRRRFGDIGGALAAVLLVTSLPFLNFAMQLRGYGLSMLFVAGLLFHCAFPRASKPGDDSSSGHGEHHPRRFAATVVLTALFSLALLYTVPSNVYFLIALVFVLFVRLVTEVRYKTKQPSSTPSKASDPMASIPSLLLRHRDTWFIAAIGIGTIATFIAYLPVLDNVLHNRFVTDTPDHRWFVLANRLPEVLRHFLSGRYLLLVAVIPGLFWAISARSRTRSDGWGAIPTLLALFLIPFLLSFLRNDVPFQRTFIHLAPVFALLLAATIEETRRRLQRASPSVPIAGRRVLRIGPAPRLAAWLPIAVAVYSVATLVVVHTRTQQRLEDALTQDVREQNIFANFYEAGGFCPLDVCRTLAGELAEKPGLVLMANELDRVAWTFYLQKFDIPSYALAQFKEEPKETTTHSGVYQISKGRSGERAFLQWAMRIDEPFEKGDRLTPLMLYVSAYDPADRIYVITGFSNLIDRVLRARYPEFLVERVAVPGSYGLFRLTRRP